MRVALIGPVPPRLGGATPGGVATHQVHLAHGLARAGIDAPLLATNTRVAPSDWRATAELPFPLYRVVRPGRARADYVRLIGARHLARYAAHLAAHPAEGSRREVLANTVVYRRFLDEVQPDLIHVQHPLERYTYVRTVQRLERAGQPVVVTAHSLHGEHAEATIQSLMAPNLRGADRVIAVNDHVAEQAIGLGVDAERVRVIRSGVDTEQFRPRDRTAARHAVGLPEQGRLVLFVGNLEPRKQVDVLLRAMADVHRELPDARLLIVGTGESAGPQDQRARLVRLARELAVEDVVEFLGRVEDDRLLGYYAAADVFALPSSSEAQGIVALEAMASGLPVVASAVGGLLGAIVDGESGRLVASGAVRPLADALREVLGDTARRTAMGAAARARVEAHFAWSSSVAATIAVYRDALGTR